MDRKFWTDERLDEKMHALEAELREFREEIHEFCREMRVGIAQLHDDLASLRRRLNRIVTAFVCGLVGIIGVAVAERL